MNEYNKEEKAVDVIKAICCNPNNSWLMLSDSRVQSEEAFKILENILTVGQGNEEEKEESNKLNLSSSNSAFWQSTNIGEHELHHFINRLLTDRLWVHNLLMDVEEQMFHSIFDKDQIIKK